MISIDMSAVELIFYVKVAVMKHLGQSAMVTTNEAFMRVVESLASEKQVWLDKITSAAVNNICQKAMIKIMY